MNERIKQLAEQAGMVRGGYANTPEMIMTWREDFDNPGALEKFAELIIKECTRITEDELENSTALDPSFVIQEIKQHFGVEE